eukprot:TRINITY_DN13352_c0_g1_i1.p1 TRINITY_DN13352_c0_g1~~TRINITY_DN13352_c0_g1_i1.p1  ORF type:complete len:237 (-),score=15.04 TRINITY_DN13352_c0_g1_i1:716-1354(-)
MEVCYAVLMIAASFFVFYSSPETFVIQFAFVFIMQLLLSVHFMKLSSALLWNFVALIANIVSAMQNHVQHAEPSLIFAMFLLTFAITIIATAGVKRWMISSARQEIHISSLKIENSASSALLDLVCDTVVQLDSKLNINHDSRAFKALLMKTSGATTKGMPFSSFIADDLERQTFEARLLNARTTAERGVGTFRTFRQLTQSPSCRHILRQT